MSDQDLDRWTAAWRADAPGVPDLAGMARRERRWLLAWIAADWSAGLAFIAFAIWLWFADGTTAIRFAAAAIVALTAFLLAFVTLNWRGSFAPEQSSTADFLALAERRSRARLRYVRCGWWVLAADVVVIAHGLGLGNEHRQSLPEMIALTLAAIAAAAAILWWWGRRERRRAERLAELRRALAADGDAS